MTAGPDEAVEGLCDAVSLWRLSAAYTGDVVDAAVACLVAGVDSPTLRQLASASPQDSQFELEPMIDTTLNELGRGHVLAGEPQRGALTAMVRRFKDGTLEARDLAAWAHRYIGHDGDPSCQVFVDLDDMYDTADYSDYDEASLDAWTSEEADAFLAGEPSPGRTEVRRSPPQATAMIVGPRRWPRRFTVRVVPGGREFSARGWTDLWGSLPEMGVPWRNVSFESPQVRDAVLESWGEHPDSPFE